jgi:hypothetical protein
VEIASADAASVAVIYSKERVTRRPRRLKLRQSKLVCGGPSVLVAIPWVLLILVAVGVAALLWAERLRGQELNVGTGTETGQPPRAAYYLDTETGDLMPRPRIGASAPKKTA